MARRPDAAEAPLLGNKPGAAASPPPPAKRNKYPFFCAVLASMTSVLMGYNVAVMSGAQIFMAEDLGITDAQIEVLSGVINIYSLVGALLAGWTSDRLGRRLTIVLANVFFLVGPLAMTLAGGYTMLMLGRFVAGVGSGYALVIAPVYAAEIAPASSRGLLTSLPEIFINSGVMLSYVSNLAFSGLPVHLSWRVMFAAGVVPTVFLAAGVLTMPESPRWLAMKGRVAEAKAVLDKTSDTPAEAEQRLLEIEGVVNSAAAAGGGGGGAWKEVATKAGVRRVLAIVLTLQFLAVVRHRLGGVLRPARARHGRRHLQHPAPQPQRPLRRRQGWLHPHRHGALRPRRPPPAPAREHGRHGGVPARPGLAVRGVRRRQGRRRRRRGERRRRGGVRRGVLRRVRPAGVGVQLGDPAAPVARAGRRARHRHEQGHERRGHHDLHLAVPGHHHGRRVLPLRRRRRGLVRVRLRVPAGDEGTEPRGHGGALPHQVMDDYSCDLR